MTPNLVKGSQRPLKAHVIQIILGIVSLNKCYSYKPCVTSCNIIHSFLQNLLILASSIFDLWFLHHDHDHVVIHDTNTLWLISKENSILYITIKFHS